MGIPPFLIGWDKGCPWKAALGFVVIPVGLVTYDPSIKSLKDFKPTDKIALPSPGSVQHILLAMAAEKELGSASALDQNLVAMAHPDGAAALISKRGITAHFTTPPYLFEELSQPDFHSVTDDIEAFGQPFSFNVVWHQRSSITETPLLMLASSMQSVKPWPGLTQTKGSSGAPGPGIRTYS